MGKNIDCKLTNHKLIELYRYTNGLRGKSGKLPNPFKGDHTMKDDPEQGVRLDLNADGIPVPHFIYRSLSTPGKLQFAIDAKDRNKKDLIIKKLLDRNNLTNDQVTFAESKIVDENPIISGEFKIDFIEFRLAILKIAYEFCVDMCPQYINDTKALEISQILLNADISKMKSSLHFFGDGFNDTIFSAFGKFIDYKNENHYLILTNQQAGKLVCYVNLFDIFHLGIEMSNEKIKVPGKIIIGKNDIQRKMFQTYNIYELAENISRNGNYEFHYEFSSEAEFEQFSLNELRKDFNFFSINGIIPLFDSAGNIKYDDIEQKVSTVEFSNLDGDNTLNTYSMNENLYVRHMPINKLFKVIAIKRKAFPGTKV